jgi:tannase/feruloyl esterase
VETRTSLVGYDSFYGSSVAVNDEVARLRRRVSRVALQMMLGTIGVGATMHAWSAGAASLPNCAVAVLSSFNVDGVTITSVADEAAAAPNPEYCWVQGTLITHGEGVRPGLAEFALKLPAAWNDRLVFFGCGANCGSLDNIAANPNDVTAALPLGYAVVNTDAGHEQDQSTPDPTWILLAPGEPDKPAIIDFDYRAVHDVTVAAKALVQDYYSGTIQHAYFDGCSTGGRQSLMEGERYPGDFDGLIAGDPVMDLDTQRASSIKQAKAFLPASAYIPYSLIPAIDAAVLANCDGLDGTVDDLIQNPAQCSFEPETLVPSVLSTAQAAGLKLFLEKLVDSQGTLVAPGMIVGDFAASGFEGQTEVSVAAPDPRAAQPWGGIGMGPTAWVLGDAGIRYYVEYNPAYDVNNDWPQDGNVISTAALEFLDRREGAADSDDPRMLHEYLRQGGKVIIYHGFSDAQASPYRTLWFYRALAEQERGYAALQSTARLFMVPGMGHCGAGSGPNSFATLSTLDSWVSDNVAPDGIVAANSMTGRSMPLCKFPEEAEYLGGPVNLAASWVCPADDRRLLQSGPDGALAGAAGP